MRRRSSVTAFYLESLLLIVVLMVAALVISGMFGLANERRVRAASLTEAVGMAENAAEAVASCSDTDTDGYVKAINEAHETLELSINSIQETERLVRFDISVYDKNSGQTVYELSTTVCRKEAP